MAFNIDDFRNNMSFDGARPNLFDITLTPLGGGVDATSLSFKAKSAQLPGSTIGMAPLFYFGRELKFAGNRTFTDWTITIINDEDFNIRNSFEKWMNGINEHQNNLRALGESPRSYTADGQVTQYSKDGQPIKQYNFVGMFPIDISPIDLDWGSNDSIEEFTVTFAYQYWQDVPIGGFGTLSPTTT